MLDDTVIAVCNDQWENNKLYYDGSVAVRDDLWFSPFRRSLSGYTINPTAYRSIELSNLTDLHAQFNSIDPSTDPPTATRSPCQCRKSLEAHRPDVIVVFVSVDLSDFIAKSNSPNCRFYTTFQPSQTHFPTDVRRTHRDFQPSPKTFSENTQNYFTAKNSLRFALIFYTWLLYIKTHCQINIYIHHFTSPTSKPVNVIKIGA